MKKKLLITGSSGLIGSVIATNITGDFTVIPADLNNVEHPTDITNTQQLRDIFAKHQPDAVVHLAAYTNVSAAWEQKGDTAGLCYQLNVTGTQNIVDLCQESNTHLVHISTAFVFDGNQSTSYVETDEPNPIEWYGKTKLMAENIVRSASNPWSILRIDKPFSVHQPARTDIVQTILDGIASNTLYPQFSDHFFGPTVIEDFTRVIRWVLLHEKTGIYHASSGESWSDYDFAQKIVTAFGLEFEVAVGSLQKYLETDSRPWQKNTALDCSKLISEVNFSLRTVADAITEAAKNRN